MIVNGIAEIASSETVPDLGRKGSGGGVRCCRFDSFKLEDDRPEVADKTMILPAHALNQPAFVFASQCV